MLVSKIMTSSPIHVPADTTLSEALALMDDQDIRHLPIVEGDDLLGVVSDRDVLAGVGWLQHRPDGERRTGDEVGAHASKVTATVEPDDTVVTAALRFVVDKIGCLPVLDDGKLVGIVTEMDVLMAYWSACRTGLLEGDVDPPVRELMHADVSTVDRAASVRDAKAYCRHLHVRHLPVVEEDQLLGIVSDRDLRGAGDDELQVGHVMAGFVVSVAPDDRTSVAAQRMGTNKISGLPVVDGERLVGIVTLTDLLDHAMNVLHEPESGALR